MASLIPQPQFDIDSERRYRLTARAKPTFKSIVPVGELISKDPSRFSVVRMRKEASGEVVMEFEYPLSRGTIFDSLTLEPRDDLGGGLAAKSLDREVVTLEGDQVRHEVVDFSDRAIPLPQATYPEVALPFLISFHPLDGKTRDLFAWINDRFVARVDVRVTGRQKVELALPGGGTGPRVEAIKAIMYPDFNDWVPLPKLISKMTVPFVPKYHMWFSTSPPHYVLKFEGPYGPPGAPEIAMTLLSED